MPDNFKQWQTKNAKRIAGATERGTLPHWYRDNQSLIERVQYRDVASTLQEASKPFQPNTYVSFEPFSPAIIEAVRKAQDRKAKNALFESILNDPRTATLHTTPNAKTTMYPNHKGKKSKYWSETQEMAKALNEQGISVCFLPEMESVSSADALLKIGAKKWTIADFKYSSTANSNTLGENLLKGFNQANTIVLKMTAGDTGTLTNAIEQAKRKGNAKALIIITKYDKVIELTKADIMENKYKRKIKGKI